MLSACSCSPEPLLAVQVAHLKALSQAGVGAAWWSSPMRAGGDLSPCPHAAPSSGVGTALNPLSEIQKIRLYFFLTSSPLDAFAAYRQVWSSGTLIQWCPFSTVKHCFGVHLLC